MGGRSIRVRFSSGRVLCATALLSLGCATFAELPEVEPAPPTLALQLSAERHVYFQQADESWDEISFGNDYDRLALRALQEHGWLAEAGAAPDATGRLVVRRYQGFMYGGILSMLTGFLVPIRYWSRVEVELTLEPADWPGQGVSCKRGHDLAIWVELLLLPIYPFRSPAGHEMRSVPRLAVACAQEAAASLRAGP